MKETFLGIPESSSEKARFHIWALSYERTTSYRKGTGKAPQAILEASSQVELFNSRHKRDYSSVGFYHHEPFLPASRDPFEALKEIAREAREKISKEHFLITLGGEHSVTAPLVWAHREVMGEDFSVVSIDAHLDLRDEFEGTKGSHACAMRRIVDRHKICVIAARSYSEEEYGYLQDHPDRVFMIEPGEAKFRLKEILSLLGEKVYLSIDVDGFDPSVIPSTGTPEPGGLSYDEGLEIIGMICSLKKVIGMDIVELIPDNEKGGYSDFTVARLLYDILGWLTG